MSSGGNPECAVWHGKQPFQEPTCQTRGDDKAFLWVRLGEMTNSCSDVSVKVSSVYKEERSQMID